MQKIAETLKERNISSTTDNNRLEVLSNSMKYQVYVDSNILDIKPIAPVWISLTSIILTIFLFVVLVNLVFSGGQASNHKFTGPDRLTEGAVILVVCGIILRLVYELIFSFYKTNKKTVKERDRIIRIIFEVEE